MQGCATAATIDNARRLAAVDDIAAALGVRPGQTVADTLALWPRLEVHDADTEADAAALKALAAWCLRFAPAVALDAPDGVFLDIDGCAHFWGGEAGMAHAVRDRLARQGIPARIAIADTFAAAWALARYGADDITLSQGDAAARLAPLPVAALRVEPLTVHRLARLGVRTIAQMHALPRPAVQKRFGASVLLQLDRALGAAEEVLDFVHPPPPWTARRVFAEPVSRPEAFQQLVRDLAEALCAKLERAGLAARRFALVLHRVDGENAGRGVGAALPMRDPKRLAALFAPKLETVDPGFGVEAAVLVAHDVAPLQHAQADLVAAAADVRNADLAPLVDRLRNRLGADNVWRAAPFASYVPERAVTRTPPLAAPTGQGWPPDRPRPVRLFRKPLPIEAVAPVPDDPPLLFRWRGRTHRIRRAEGPERIGAEWWRAAWADNDIDRVRDYYRVEDEAGARYWLFRTGLYGHDRPTKWFLHGVFA